MPQLERSDWYYPTADTNRAFSGGLSTRVGDWEQFRDPDNLTYMDCVMTRRKGEIYVEAWAPLVGSASVAAIPDVVASTVANRYASLRDGTALSVHTRGQR